MTYNFRHTEILDLARAEGRVLVDDLAQRFGVSLQTIRRDLQELDRTGELERVHGGAVLPSGVTNIAYTERRNLNADAKERIARAVAASIPDHASLFLNIGTTTEAVARALLRHEKLLVVSNNLNVAQTLSAAPGFEVIVTGGVLRPADGGLVGDATVAAVAQFKVDVAVIGASAMDLDGDILDFDHREVQVTKTILRHARRRVLVADVSKFQRTAPVRVGSLAEVDVLVTDAPPPAPVAAFCAAQGTQVQIADGQG